MSRILLVVPFALGLFLPIAASAAEAPGSVLIWPVNPVIEGEDRATALWLENPGTTPVTLQVAIYSWAQLDGKNAYAIQQDIVASPPIITVLPGSKQLVRLSRITQPPTQTERPYRVIVDEIPVDIADKSEPRPAAAISFRMRYSLPLFSYAVGAGAKAIAKSKVAPPAPKLRWSIAEDGEGNLIEIGNDGPVHARLTDVSFAGQTLSAGLLGYALPGSSMQWRLASKTPLTGDLVASVNGAPAIAIAPQTR